MRRALLPGTNNNTAKKYNRRCDVWVASVTVLEAADAFG